MTTDPDCVFCKIIAGDLPCDKVLETDTVLAFNDIRPMAPTHVLFVPKRHVATLNDLADDDPIVHDILAAVKRVARERGVAEKGYRVLMNVNEAGGQIVFHYHVHLISTETSE
jgi:histidine triad (HIT) family protein